jgi:ligand-binding sensor domain-containing protein
MKRTTHRRALFIAAIIGIASAVQAQPFQWQTFTSTSDAYDIESVSGGLWAATSGGLVHFEPASGVFDPYTNTRGLSANRCVAVGSDSRGGVWVGLDDRRLNRLDPTTGRMEVLSYLEEEVFSLTDIIAWQDFVLVASDVGAYRLAYYENVAGFRVQESYSKLGEFSPRTEVRRLAVADNYLWAATPFGLARGNLDLPTLVSPSAWENITEVNGLPSNDVRAIMAAPGGGLWVGTAAGVVLWKDGIFIEHREFDAVRDLANVNDTIYVVTSTRAYWLDPSFGWRDIGGPITFNIQRLAVFSGSDAAVLWTAVANRGNQRGGLAALVGTQWTDPIRSEGPGGNDISALAVSPAGQLWVGARGSQNSILNISTYSGGNWTDYVELGIVPQPFCSSEVRAFAFDDFGGIWVGTHGRGLGWIRGDSTRIFNSSDSTGARITGIADDPKYCLVDGVAKDIGGNLWLTNRLSTRGTPLLRIAREWIGAGGPEDPWMAYVNPSMNRPTEVEQIVIDLLGRKWLGASAYGDGTHVLDDGGTPLDTLDDLWTFIVPNDHADPTFCFDAIDEETKCWAVDAQGYLWVGTINGVYYTPMGVPADLRQLQFTCLYPGPLGTQVFAIHVDAEDNKWFGTDGGVSVMDRDFNWIHYFRTAEDVLYPSGLVSNYVTALTSNPVTGEVWIGTPDGLSRLKTPYQQTGAELGEVQPYPNPFRPGVQHMYVQDIGVFDGMKVYTVSGRLVRSLTWREMITPGQGWDGRNSEGRLISSGVYILVCYTNDGKTSRGKVAVLVE